MSVSHLFNNPQLETTILKKRPERAIGAPILGEKKQVAANKDIVPGAHLAKIERDAEEGNTTLPKIPLQFRLQMQKARTEKKLTQADLAKSLNLPLEIVKKYEAGTIVPQGAHMGKIKRALGI